MTSQARADRILDEFTEGAYWGERHTSIRHGLARVLRHLADTEAGYSDEESWYAVPANALTDLADALEAPTLLERAMKGDAAAARQFLYEGGFTDANGNLLPHLRSAEEVERWLKPPPRRAARHGRPGPATPTGSWMPRASTGCRI